MFKERVVVGLMIFSIILSGCMPKESRPEEGVGDKESVSTSSALAQLSPEKQAEYNDLIKNAYKLFLWAKYNEALDEFLKAAEIAQTDEAFFNVATIYANNRGENRKAYQYFYKVYQLNPDYDFGPDFARGFTLGLLSNGKFEDVLKWSDIALKKWYSNGEPGIGYILRTRVFAYREMYQFDKVVELAKQYLKEYPDRKILQKSLNPLIDFFENNRDEGTDEPLKLYAQTRMWQLPETKIKKFLEILEKYPDTKLKDEIYYQVGKLYGTDSKLYGLQDFEKEIEYMDKLIKECPDSPYLDAAQREIDVINFRFGRSDKQPTPDDSWYKGFRKTPLPGGEKHP